MPTKVAFRVLYIELIICGFLACVLVARNLCLSETGAPISCLVTRLGNATGKGASDGATSGAKVNVLSEGEVLNMGARRRNIKIEKKFKPLFLVSKDRSGLAPPKVSDDRKSRLLQVVKDMPGKYPAEPQWSEERSEVMQSPGQLPEEQGIFEFLDMFQVSDWLPDKRRQKGEASRRTGSEVDSRAEWYASKGVEQDYEAGDSSKMKGQHVDAEEKRIDSEEEVFRSIISKAKPVRVKATIVTKTMLPRTRLFGSKSKTLTATAEDVTQNAETDTSKDKPLTDPKAPSVVLNTPTVNDFLSFSAIVVPGTSSNRTNASSLIPTETNPDSNDLFSPPEAALISSLEKEESKDSDFSDDNSGLVANILNAIFRGDDAIETPEESAFDVADPSEAARSDAEEEEEEEDVSDELMDRLSRDIFKDVSDDAEKSTEVEHSTEGNGTLEAAQDQFEDAENRSEVAENRFGGENDSSMAANHVSTEPSESTNASEKSANVSTHGDSLEVRLVQGQHTSDNIFGAKDSSPRNEKDTSNSPINDSYNAVNEKEEAVGKGIQKKTHDMSLKSKDNIPLERKDSQLKTTDVLVKAKNITDETKDVTVNGNVIPVKDKYVSVIAKVVSTETEPINVKANDITVQATDSPSKAHRTTENIRNAASDVTVKIEDILATGQDITAGVDDIPANTHDIMAPTTDDILVEQKDLSKKVTDMPATAEGIPVKQEDVSETANDMKHTKAAGIPTKQEVVSKKANDVPIKAEDIQTKQEDLSRKANDKKPTKAQDISIKQEDLSKKAEDIKPTKAEGISTKQEDLSKKAEDIKPTEAEGIPMKQENLPKKAEDMPIEAEGIPTKQEDLSKKAEDMPIEAEDTSDQDEPEPEPEPESDPEQLQDEPPEPADSSSSAANDAKGHDQKSTLDNEEVKMAMFTEMGNIMSDLDYLGTLWERLKPGMKLKNSDAVRKVLHAVADVFGLENKEAGESSSSGKSDPEKTAAAKLRYDAAVQRAKDDQAQKEFKDVSSHDVPGGQQKRVGLRSKRSLAGKNRRRNVQATNPRGLRGARRRHMDSGDRKYKRLSEEVYKREDGEEENDEDLDEDEKEMLVEEDVRKKKRDEDRLRKRGGYEDYIFGNNPGYVLSRQKRFAPQVNATLAAAEDKTEDKAEDKAEEDAISRELANLLIEKVYNRVMKSLRTPKLETEAGQPPAKPNEMQEDEEFERWIRISGKADGYLKRFRRNVDPSEIQRYCEMMKNEKYNFTDENGRATDLYTEAVNSGLCLGFAMKQASEREMEKRELPTFAEDEVEEEERDVEKEVVERGTSVDVEGESEGQAAEEANREVKNEIERVEEREVKGETKELAQEEANREAKNEIETVVQREVKTDVKGETQRQAQEEDKREISNEVEGSVDRKVNEEGQEEAENEAERKTENEAENEVGNEEEEMDVGEEESEKEELSREARDEPLEDPNDAADAWDFAKDEFHEVLGDVEKRSVDENVDQKGRKDLKSRRRSGAEEETEDAADRDAEDFVKYVNLRSGEADEKAFDVE